MSDATARNPSWDAPECPDCESEVFVEARTDGETFVCHLCGTTFEVRR